KQMIKLKGTSLYPQSIIEVMNQVTGITAFVIEARRGELGIDAVTVKIPEGVSLETLNELYEQFRSKLQVAPEIEVVSLDEIETLKFPGESKKPQVFRDFRSGEYINISNLFAYYHDLFIIEIGSKKEIAVPTICNLHFLSSFRYL